MSVLRKQHDRTLSRQASARRDQILEAAIEAMARKGFHETSIADIASRARASRATVYQYFGDKRDILAAIGQRVEQAILAAIDTWVAMPAGGTGEDVDRNARSLIAQLRAMIEARVAQVITALSAHVDAARLVLRLVRGKDGLDDVMRRIDGHVVGLLAADIRTGIERGWARSCDAEMTARYLLGGIEKMLMDALDPEQPIPLDMERVVPEIGALVFFGLVHPNLVVQAANAPRVPSRAGQRRSGPAGRPASQRKETDM